MLIHDLEKAVVERALDAEMDTHLEPDRRRRDRVSLGGSSTWLPGGGGPSTPFVRDIRGTQPGGAPCTGDCSTTVTRPACDIPETERWGWGTDAYDGSCRRPGGTSDQDGYVETGVDVPNPDGSFDFDG